MHWEEFWNRWTFIAEQTTTRYFVIAGVVFVIFYFLLYKILANRRNQTTLPGWKHYSRDIIYSLFTIVIFATMATLVFTVFNDYSNL